MKRYILTSPKINKSIEVWYNDVGLLSLIDMRGVQFSGTQMEMLTSHLALEEKQFKQKITPTGLIVKELEIVINFDDFNLVYPYSRNTHLAKDYWAKIHPKQHVSIYLAAIDYREYCKRNEWYKPMIAVKWLKQKEYMNDWKNL